MAQCRATVTIGMVHFFQTPSASSLVALFVHKHGVEQPVIGIFPVTFD